VLCLSSYVGLTRLTLLTFVTFQMEINYFDLIWFDLIYLILTMPKISSESCITVRSSTLWTQIKCLQFSSHVQ